MLATSKTYRVAVCSNQHSPTQLKQPEEISALGQKADIS